MDSANVYATSNGMAFSCRERVAHDHVKNRTTLREAVGWYAVFGGDLPHLLFNRATSKGWKCET
jgi:hypothetical protein